MPYVKVIHPDQATGRLKKIYDRVTGPGGQVDNVLQIRRRCIIRTTNCRTGSSRPSVYG
jgi:hypothetical protein